MCKVTLTDEDGIFKTCLVSNETVNQVLEHFRINPDTKIVYMDGKILSKEKMKKPFPKTGVVHLAVKNKTVIRI